MGSPNALMGGRRWTMKILALTYERDWDLPEHEVLYLDRNDIEQKGWADAFARIMVFKPDLIVEREFNDGKAIYDPIYRAFAQVPKAWWWIDSHISFDARKDYARNFDYLFLAVSRNVKPLKQYLGHDRVHWLPLCWPYQANAITPNTETKEYDISFVGRWNREWFPQRTEYIERLKARYGDRFHAVTDYQNMLSIVRRSKVSFNCAIQDDLNFRVFEVLGCGTQLVTNLVDDLFKVEGLAGRVVYYQSFDDLVHLIDLILEGNPNFTRDTVDNQQWVKSNHCLCHRLRYIINTVNGHTP